MSSVNFPVEAQLGGVSLTGPSISMAAVRRVMEAAATLFTQITTKVLQFVQQQLEAASLTTGQLALKVATPIAAGISAGEATVTALGSQVQAAAVGGVAAATAQVAAGGRADTGVTFGQYLWNVYQEVDAPTVVTLIRRDWGPPVGVINWCFRGGWDDFYDALRMKSVIAEEPLPAGCRLPGGLAAPPPPPAQLPPGVCFQAYIVAPGGNVLPYCVQDTCDKRPGPNTYPFGPQTFDPASTAEILRVCQSLFKPCPPSTVTAVSWNAGCSAAGKTYVWSVDEQPPAGLKTTVGPLPTPQEALDTLGTCCPPPPPPTSGGTAGGCCDPVTGKVMLPDCIMLDLCDWKKFEDALVAGLCRWYDKCVCKLDNTTAYEFSDCDGTLTTGLSSWYGNGLGAIATADTLESAAQKATAYMDWQGPSGPTAARPARRPALP